MDRGEKRALIIAALGHAAVLAALSLGWLSASRKLPPVEEAFAVDLVNIAAVSSAPARVERTAPEQGPDETPEPAPEPEPQPKPEPAPPEPTPAPKPTPEKPKPTPEKPKPEKPAPDKSKQAQKPTPDKAPPKSRLGKSWLASVIGDAKPSAAPSQISAQAAAGLAQAIRQQVQPCWNPPAGGADVNKIVTILRIQFRKDGSVVGQPQVTSQSGVDGGNASYARQHAEAAKRAVLRCQPLQLPADLYQFWKDIEFNFDARLND